tara:strand:- start:624 stop:803 length:180 start_codon:yes stop_codon:yes gene_type:complete
LFGTGVLEKFNLSLILIGTDLLSVTKFYVPQFHGSGMSACARRVFDIGAGYLIVWFCIA